MLNWVLVVLMFSGGGSGITTIRVSSKESCERLAKEMPKFLGRTWEHVCFEDKQ